MDKEQTLLLVISDLKNKLADAEHRASDYRAQAIIHSQKAQDLEYIRQVIDGSPELRALFEQTLEKTKEGTDGIGNL